MDISPDRSCDQLLWPANAPWAFWQLLESDFTEQDWHQAASAALYCLAGLPAASLGDSLGAIANVLGEGQSGPRPWQLSRSQRLYYAVIRPYLPARLRPVLRSLLKSRQKAEFTLGWPIDERFVRFMFETVRRLLEMKGLASVPYVHFWPDGSQFAFVLTHDVEAAGGQRFVREVAALEERYGFRSSFNFVPEAYEVDRALLAELAERGFEIGVHGLKHDGRLYSSRATFLSRARRINEYLREWGAVGFRSPFTHRHPVWMQALDVEYDSSFFDVDPFETMPGGTLSIWPFTLGRFVELPCTLVQDHTLMVTLGEATPRLWLEKVEFIERGCGLALLNSHPDYLANPKHLAIYETFLRQMRERATYWHALPREVARWWQRRSRAVTSGSRSELPDLPGATIGQIRISGLGEPLVLSNAAPAA